MTECPVCFSPCVVPRLYECGHTVCELCMLKSDLQAEVDTSLNTFPLYRCPVCRCGSLLVTSDRPINHAMIHILREREDYEELEKRAADDKAAWMDEHFCSEPARGDLPACNLAAIAYETRQKKAFELYRKIRHIVEDAAVSGRSYVRIATRVRELQEFAREIAQHLFQHGVHSVHANSREVLVYILPPSSDGMWKDDFVNANYQDPTIGQEAANAAFAQAGEVAEEGPEDEAF